MDMMIKRETRKKALPLKSTKERSKGRYELQKRREEKFRGVEKCQNPFEEAVSLRFLTLAKGRLEKNLQRAG